MSMRQVNIRIPEEEAIVLDAAAFVDGISSITEYLRPVVSQIVEELRDDSAVQTAVRLRVERAATKEGKLSSLDAHRRHGEQR